MKMIKFMLGVAVAVLCIGSAHPACAENYTYRLQWGETGNGDGQFLAPHGIAVDIKSGNIYVCDYFNNRIQKFNSIGSVLSFKRLPSGSGDGQLVTPTGVAVDASGNVYVCDNGNNRVQKFDSNGTFITKWGAGSGDGAFSGPFAGPMGIAVDAKSGNVYVSDYGANRIQKFNSNGSVLPFKRLPTGAGDGQLRQPAGVAVDAITGNVYVCDQGNHRIQKFDSNGIFIKTWGTVGSRNSEFGPPLSSGKYNGPFGITVDASGNVYVCDNGNQRIQKFDSIGTFITAWGELGSDKGQFEGPLGVATDASGNVYVSDSVNDRIQKFGNFVIPPSFSSVVKILFGVTNDGDGAIILPNGAIVIIHPSGPPDPIFKSLRENMQQVLQAVTLYESTLAVPGVATKTEKSIQEERKRALLMSIGALKKMESSLGKALHGGK